jgi:Dna[CI] antecedent, DciA
MVRSPQPIQRILRSDATLAGWAERRDREEVLAGIVRRHLPRPLAPRIRIAEERNGQLELAADAGAVAAMVRQRSAELLTALKREGWEFTGIRVRVQVRTDPAPHRKPLANPVDRASLQPLSALARTLPDGPLKAALERFVRRAG